MQLETVYVLEGLGPPKDEAAAGRTFADQVLPQLIQPIAFGPDVGLAGNRLHCMRMLPHITCEVTCVCCHWHAWDWL